MKTASALAALILVFSFLIAGTASVGVYDPWADLDNDGDIDIYDIVYIAGIYGSEGENITKTSVEFDSGWINITDEAGQYFYITHNLNTIDWDSPNTIADITGKTTIGGGLLRLGLANYARHQTYGGAYIDTAYSMVQTTDGGYALAGLTMSFGAGSFDVWLVEADFSVDGLTWTDSTDDAILLYRSEADVHWNYIRVRILKVREYPEDYP